MPAAAVAAAVDPTEVVVGAGMAAVVGVVVMGAVGEVS